MDREKTRDKRGTRRERNVVNRIPSSADNRIIIGGSRIDAGVRMLFLFFFFQAHCSRVDRSRRRKIENGGKYSHRSLFGSLSYPRSLFSFSSLSSRGATRRESCGTRLPYDLHIPSNTYFPANTCEHLSSPRPRSRKRKKRKIFSLSFLPPRTFRTSIPDTILQKEIYIYTRFYLTER